MQAHVARTAALAGWHVTSAAGVHYLLANGSFEKPEYVRMWRAPLPLSAAGADCLHKQ